MKTLLKSWVVRVLALTLAASVAFAQDRVPFRQEELDQMLAPVALYPDPLLSQILMASTYPLEVVQAARWSRANPGLEGQNAVQAVANRDWDSSVKSLTAFPQVLAMMDEKLDWTERLGEAFLAQQADVMDSVQALRRRAEAAGNLRSSDQMHVARQGEVIYIQQPAPEIVYVPHYDPVVVYGPWRWPAHPPVYWAPPRAHYVVPAHRPAFLWGPGIVISVNFFFGQPDWHRRHVTVFHHHRTRIVNRGVAAANVRPAVWRHEPDHRRGVPFRSEVARDRFEQIRADTRRDAARNDTQVVRRLEDTRTTDIRQSRRDERRNAVQDRREDRRDSIQVRGDEHRNAVQGRREDRRDSIQVRGDERRDIVQDRREATVSRVTPSDVRRPNRAVSRNDEGVRPASQPAARNVRPNVMAPVIRTDPRPAAAPVIRSEHRPTPAAPAIRSEPRHDPRPVVATHVARPVVATAVPRAEQRAAPRNFAGAAAARPHPVASAPNPAPRAERDHGRGDRGARVRRD